MEVHLYHVKDNPREGTNLFAYVPRDRMLVQAISMIHLDAASVADNFRWNLEYRKLRVEKMSRCTRIRAMRRAEDDPGHAENY